MENLIVKLPSFNVRDIGSGDFILVYEGNGSIVYSGVILNVAKEEITFLFDSGEFSPGSQHYHASSQSINSFLGKVHLNEITSGNLMIKIIKPNELV